MKKEKEIIHDNVKRWIKQVKGKLKADSIKYQDKTKAIKCLKECVGWHICINVYKKYIFKAKK